MQWLYPAGAWALLSLAVIAALYLLKRQSVQKTAPSLLLWRRPRRIRPRRAHFKN